MPIALRKGFFYPAADSERPGLLAGWSSLKSSTRRRMVVSRLSCVLLVAVIGLGVAAPPAVAVPENKLGDNLGAVWEAVLETPTAQNPFGGGSPCVDLGGVVAPFAPLGTTSLTCTVKPGTKVFIAAESSECSTVEPPPFFGANEADLRACARAADAGFEVPTISVDGTPVSTIEVESGLLSVDLPTTNILGVPPQQAFSVAHGWVALLHPLTPGTHEIRLHVEGTDAFGTAINIDNTTTIVVQPHS
jgi:hypothetical protein